MNKLTNLLVLLALAAVAALGANMGSVDTYSNTTATSTIYADTTLTDITGVAVDLDGYRGCLIVAEVGPSEATLATDLKIELEVEESDASGSGFTDVADNQLLGYVAGTNDGCFGVINGADDDSTTYYCSYIGNKRYVRVVVNCIGVIDGLTPVSATVIRSEPDYGPVH